MGSYGGVVLATNLLNWLITNVDRTFIGRWLPGRDLGLYSQTYNLLCNPTGNLLGVVQPVFFSAAARSVEADNQAGVQAAYLGVVSGVATFLLPMFVFVAVMAEPFVLFVYGPRWADAAALCIPLALAMPLFLLWGLSTPLLWTAGRPSDELRTQLPLAVLWAVGCALAAQSGVVAVAWATLAFFGIRAVVVVRLTLRRAALHVHQLGAALRGGLMLAIAVAILEIVILQTTQSMAATVQLGVSIALTLPVVCVLLRVFPALLSPELRMLLSKLAARLPPRGAQFLQMLLGSQFLSRSS